MHDLNPPRRNRANAAALAFTAAFTLAALPTLTFPVPSALASPPTGTTPWGTTPLRADVTKPVTTDDVVDSESTVDNWRAKPFTVSLAATDDAPAGETSSGVATIEFRILRADGTIGDTGHYVSEQTKVVLSDGDRVQYRAIDAAGNKEAWKTSEAAKIDTHAPTVSASTVSATWQHERVTVTLTDTDQSELSGAGGSGVAARYVKVVGPGSDADGYTAYHEDDLPTLANGQRLQYYSVDRVGNVSGVKTTAAAKVDLVAPVVDLDPAELSDLVQSGPITVTMSGSDALSGFGSGSYAVYRGDATDPVRTGTWADGDTIRLGNTERLVVVLTDRAGNRATAQTNAATVDGLAPTTTDDVPVTGWVTSAPFTATLSATDTPPEDDTVNGETGVKRTYFQIQRPDNSPYTDPLVYDAEHAPTLGAGERITYYSVDMAGNLERSHVSAAIRVDGETPTTTASTIPSTAQKAPVEVTLTAADTGGSGLKRTLYHIDSERSHSRLALPYDPAHKPVLDDGDSLEYWSVDIAGNIEDSHETSEAKVDLTAPESSAETSADLEEWNDAPVQVSLTADDEAGDGRTESGVASIRYRIVNGSTQSAERTYDPADLPALGNGDALEYYAVDKAGNAEVARQTGAAHVDTVAPAITFAADVPAGGWAHGPVNVTPTITDQGSGVDEVEYQVVPKGATPGTSWTPLFRVLTKALTDGETLRVRATDDVGNQSPIATYGPVKVDATPPVTTASALPDTATGPIAVALTATDERSGIAEIRYSVVGAGQTSITASQVYDDAHRPTLANGESLRYWAVDVAGNAETPKTTAAASVVPVTPTPTAAPAAARAQATAPTITPTPTPAKATPSADFARDADNSRIVLEGRQVPVSVKCGPVPCIVRVAVTFTSKGKTVVALPVRTVTTPANGAATTVGLSTTRAQRSKIRKLVGKTGAGGEVRTTLTVVDAAGNPLGSSILTRRGLSTAVIGS